MSNENEAEEHSPVQLQNVETLRRFGEAVERHDLEGAAKEMVSRVEIDDRDIPDADGQDSFRDWIGRWNLGWDSWRTEETDVIPIGDERVLSLFRMIATGQESGIELTRDDAILVSFREGKIVGIAYYNDQAEALEAAGLPQHRRGR